jgi:hypothetical protein
MTIKKSDFLLNFMMFCLGATVGRRIGDPYLMRHLAAKSADLMLVNLPHCQDYGQQKHIVHKTLTMSNRCLSIEKNSFEIESYKIRLFSFSAAPAEYSFWQNIRPIIFIQILGRKRFWSITNSN